MKRKRLLAAVMAAVMASTLTMGMPVTGYAMDQGTETVANEPEGSNSSDTAVTNPELDADSVPESTDEKSTAEESDAVSESQEMKPDSASVAESTEAEGGAVAAPDAQNNTVGVAEDSEAVSEIKKFADFNYVEERGGFFPGIYISSYTGIEASITIPDAIDGKTVVGIRGRAFDGCTSLQQVTFSKNLTQIGEEAFWGCTNLKKIVFLGNDTEGTNIGEYAFGKCTALQDVTLRDYITIGNGAFSGCKALTQITLPDSVHLGIGAFSGTSLKEITIPDTGWDLPDTGWDLTETFIDCKSLQKVTILGGVDTRNRTMKCTFFGCTSLQEVSIFDNNITAITNSTFSGCTSLQQITIPDSVTNIDDSVFEGCTSLKEITIPNSVMNIGYYTFKDCTSLQQITIPNSVTSIGGDAFEGCTSLKEIAIPNSVTSIGWGAFKDCTLLQKAIIPESVNRIGRDAFQNCTSLTEITIPGGVTSIGGGAFRGCTSLQEITIPNSVTSIGWGAFGYCESLQQITLPNSVTSIGYSAFESCSSLQQITIPDGVTSLKNMTFKNCSSLQQITIPDSVTSIGIGAFYGCTSLQEITIPDGVTSIYNSAFYGCSSLTRITIPDSVTSIEVYAFYGCKALQQITIPDGVTYIGSHAFEGCTSLTAIYFYGNAPEHSGGDDSEASFPSGVTLYVLKDKSGWTVPTWEKWHTAYFTPGDENKPASTYDPDYTQTFEDLMTGTGTMYSVKWLTKNENFPHFSFVYEHDQKIGTYITATITNVLYRNNSDNLDGLKEMFSGSVSKDYAKQVLLAFMEQKSEENKTLVKAREAQNTAKKIADGFDKFIKRNDFAIPPEDRKHLELFFHSDTIDKKLQEGKYQDLVLMCHLNGYKDSSAVVKALKAYQKASEFSKILTGTLGITGAVLDLKEDYDTLVQQIYNYKVTSETNQIYIELLEYIRDNVKYEVVKDAAEDILNVLNTETDDQWKKITAAFLTEKGEKVVTSKVIGALEEAVKKLPYGEIIERAYKWSKGECNKVFGTANYEEQYDNMRVLAYLGDAIGQWTLKNYVSYFKTDDITQKNTFARKSYYGLRLLLKTREDGEEALQGLWTGKGTDDFKNSQLYRVSVEVSGALKKKESLLFTADRDKAFYATAAACPVDVEVYNAAGEKVLTIKNGQEIPFTTSGDILYTEYQNPGSGEYDKIVILPKDAGYTLKYVGTGLGTMILHTMDANTEMTTEKYLQNIPITSSTVVEMTDPSGNSGNLTLTTGKDSQKTTMKLRPLESTYVPVTSLTFPSENLKLKEGESSLVTVKVGPENATDQSITWTSASDSIATVSADGVVTGKSAGTTTLTASAEDGKVTKKLTVTVTKKADSGKSQESRSMYRLYNPNSGEHFYTSNQGERDHLVSLGWRYEGVAVRGRCLVHGTIDN